MLSIVQTQNALWCGLDMYENQSDYDTIIALIIHVVAVES